MLVVGPYSLSVPLAFAAAQRLEGANAAGLVALAIAPGAFLAPAVVTAAGGRRSDMAGALLLGTLILSFVLVIARPGASSLALTAAQALVDASLAAGAMPTSRDRILVPLRWAGSAAALAVVGLAIAGSPRVDTGTVVIALVAVAVTLIAASATALVLRRDVFSAVAAVGTRDPITAIALAWSTGGIEATGVPLVTAAILGILAGALIIRRR